MNRIPASLLAVAATAAFIFVPNLSRAAGDDVAPAVQEPADSGDLDRADVPANPKDHPRWTEMLKTKYSLTQAEIDEMAGKKIAYPQMAMVSELALKSGKTRAEIIAMRVDQKMGWGKIAKTLNLPPGELGQSVAAMHHEMRANKAEHRKERMEKREQRMEKREEKMAKREERKAAREAKKK